MSMQAVGSLVDRWMQDAAFRAAMRKDPEGALKASGATFSAEEIAAFRQIDWSMNDEALKTRISKVI